MTDKQTYAVIIPRMNKKDTLYSTPQDTLNFVFDKAVAEVFPDMVERSVPGYATVIAGAGLTAGLYAQPHTRCYDLGCSVGASTFAMAQQIQADGCTIIAVDNSEDMLTQCEDHISKYKPKVDVQLQCADIRDVAIENASVVILNYTLQFVPLEDREALLQNIYQGMNDDGVLILSEKIAFDDEKEQQEQTRLHEAFKRTQGYSDLEISQKRTALENILIPETFATHVDRLSRTGFKHTQQWFRCFNFISLLAWK